MRRGALLALLTALVAVGLAGPAVAAAASGPVSLVDTRDGTLGPGFPQVGAAVPFGMISPGPDTALPPGGTQDPVDYVGYSYQDSDIRGFSLTHFDGAGIQIAGDLPFMPTTGTVDTSDPLGNTSPYEHATETAQPGYYAVTLTRYDVRAELSATTRAAIMRFTFPATTQANVLADVARGINGAHSGAVTVADDHTLTGSVKSDVGYTVYFAARFDRPFKATAMPGGEYVTFDTTSNPVVTMRVGISYVDLAGAENNLAKEIPDTRSFDSVRSAAQADWNRHLSLIGITGGTNAEQETFYDNVYRSMLEPAIFDDADGRYLGMDRQIHTVPAGHHHYTNLSLWDVYRSQIPLLELIDPGVTSDILSSLIDDADQNNGVVPRWVQANIDRGIMAGDSGAVTLADGAAAGLVPAANVQHALGLLVAQATKLPPDWPREHLDAYLRYGYVPYDVDGIGASLTLEYGIDDNAVASLARALGDTTDAAGLQPRADYWEHLVDPSSKFIRPRNADGSWANPTQPSDPSGETGLSAPINLPYEPIFQDGYQEGTGWQYLWSVPQDPPALATSIGGTKVALRRLDRFFSTALNAPAVPAVALAQQYTSFFGVYYIGDQYTSANEPDLWTPWFYDWYGQPWKAQKVARAEMATYDQTPVGMPGNDDAGEMSAWYVLAALGIYHAAPGVDAWELSSPAFPTIKVGHLRIDAAGASPLEPYVHALTLNGVPVKRTYLTTCELRSGGTLRYTLGATADRKWGTGAGAAPPSVGHPSAAVDACAAKLAPR